MPTGVVKWFDVKKGFWSRVRPTGRTYSSTSCHSGRRFQSARQAKPSNTICGFRTRASGEKCPATFVVGFAGANVADHMRPCS